MLAPHEKPQIRHFFEGQRITITQHPLAGMTGTVTYVKNRGARVVVCTEMLNRPVSLELPSQFIEAEA